MIGSSPNFKMPTELSKVRRIVFLGDSITEQGEYSGGWVDLVRGYLKVLMPEGQIELVNKGISGQTSADMLARFKKDVLDLKPDLLFIAAGTNDLSKNIPAPICAGTVGLMLDSAQKAGISASVVSLPLTEESGVGDLSINLFNKALKEEAGKYGANFIDVQTPLAQLVREYRLRTGGRDYFLTDDGVHLNSAGNAAFAQEILTGLGISEEARKDIKAIRNSH